MKFLLSKLESDSDYMHVLYELLVESGIIDNAEMKTTDAHELQDLSLLRDVVEQWANENIELDEESSE